MKISHIHIENFRNFKKVDVDLSKNLVLIGENQIGKSNFIYALRLILDPTLSDSDRQLSFSDFWGGHEALAKGKSIKISINFTNFMDDIDLAALFADYIASSNPLTARITYLYRPISTLNRNPIFEEDYEYIIYGGGKEENIFGYAERKRIPLTIIDTINDGDKELFLKKKNPLNYFQREISKKVEMSSLKGFSKEIKTTGEKLRDNTVVKDFVDDINAELQEVLGKQNILKASLGFEAENPKKIINSLNLLLGEDNRAIQDSSLGVVNVLNICLKELELNKSIAESRKDYSFLCIEEPETHLHPHLQRMVYRNFLDVDRHQHKDEVSVYKKTVIVTTNSPDIISVAPIKSIVLLKHDKDGSTKLYSTANMTLNQLEYGDLQRYLEATGGKILFAKRVILVESDAEEFIIPALAKHLDIDLDENGISVCSVKGTNFKPYIKLLEKLKVPYSLLTDLDPVINSNPLAYKRVLSLLEVIIQEGNLEEKINLSQFIEEGRKYGIFVNIDPLEIELFKAGRHKSIIGTLHSLTENDSVKERTIQWNNEPQTLDYNQFLGDIKEIGRVRFAQAYSTILIDQVFEKKMFPQHCPDYIREALEYVLQK